MAYTYANMPAAYLIILRSYEIILLPLIVLIVFGANKIKEKGIIAIFVVMSLPFIGIIDSRGKLLALSLTFLALVPYRHMKQIIARKSFYALSLTVTGVLAAVSYNRSLSYRNSEDFIYTEFVERLNGTNLLLRLLDTGNLPLWGTFDFGIFSPIFLRFIPFSEEGAAYKEAGITSSKQYILSDVLHSSEIDYASSLITDPAYFGGFFGVIILFGLLGFLSRFIDIRISYLDHMQSKLKVALYCSVAMALTVFETDFLGAISNFLLFSMVLIALAFLGLERVLVTRIDAGPQMER